MAFKDKLENDLNESRILLLGTQVLIGFGTRAVFQPEFLRLSKGLQHLQLVSLALMLLSFTALLSPAAFHHIADKEQTLLPLHIFTHKMLFFTFVPFGLGLALDVFVAGELVATGAAAYAMGAAAFGVSLFLWYGLEYGLRWKLKQEGKLPMPKPQEQGELELKDKVKEVLIEARMVIPGVQALLGFQFVTMMTEQFQKLPAAARQLHLFSLLMLGLCVVLLMSPAAYHRIVMKGEDSEQLVAFAGRVVLMALPPLAVAIAADIGIILWIIEKSAAVAWAGSLAVLVAMLGFWFGYMWYRRLRGDAEAAKTPDPHLRSAA